jgi:hypothetical protein
MVVTEKDIRKVLFKHPWLPYEYAKRMAEDSQRIKSSNPEGFRMYQREYMRLRRAELKGEVSDVQGVIAGKYQVGRGRKKKKIDS